MFYGKKKQLIAQNIQNPLLVLMFVLLFLF